MKMFLDSNIFLFALIGEGPSAESALNLLDRIARGECEAITSVLVLDEVMWGLHKKKEFQLEQSIRNIYELPNLTVVELYADAPLVAVEFIKKYNLKPRDAMHCAFMQQHGISTIASNDSDFDKIKGIKRIKVG